jgi:FlaA1/EpsC-like NDP-sugar epimerase
MSINENLFARKVVSENRVAEARKVLWSFPTRDEGARRGRELGQQIVAVAFAGDIVVILAALLLTFYIRFQTPIREWGINSRPELSDYLGYIILASVVYVGMLGYGGVYDHRNLLKLRLVTARILKWSIAWIGLILLASFLVKFEPPVSRIYCVMAWVITPGLLVVWRSGFQLLLIRTSALSALRQRVVFAGWNQHSAHLVRNFIHSSGSGYEVIGYIHGHADERTEISIPYLGSIEEAERIIS